MTTPLSSESLDHLVKGSPEPSTSTARVKTAALSDPPSIAAASSLLESKRSLTSAPSGSGGAGGYPLTRTASLTTDPLLSTLPSSPPQIYLNLLILEANLRAQYLALQARRRIHTFFMLVLAASLSSTTYALFFRSREDGKGQGGSPYWMLDTLIKLLWLGGVLTALLTWATGLWERGMRWPRRWVSVTNRGLRGMNLKVVVLKGPWWKRGVQQGAWLLAVWYLLRPGSQGVGLYRWMSAPEKHSKIDGKFAYREGSVKSSAGAGHGFGSSLLKEEDVSPGGDALRLMLLPKHFSAEFREGWEKYRDDYWAKENQRRADLRKVVKKEDRDKAKAQGGWLWWTGWRGWSRIFGEQNPLQPVPASPRKGSGEKTKTRRQSLNRDGSRDTMPRKSRASSIIHEETRARKESRSSSRGSSTTDSQPRPQGPPRPSSSSRNVRPSSSRSGTGTPIPSASTSTSTSSTTRQTRSSHRATPPPTEDDIDELGDEDADADPATPRPRSPHPATGPSAMPEAPARSPSSSTQLRHRASNLSDASTADADESDYSVASNSTGGRPGDGNGDVIGRDA